MGTRLSGVISHHCSITRDRDSEPDLLVTSSAVHCKRDASNHVTTRVEPHISGPCPGWMNLSDVCRPVHDHYNQDECICAHITIT
uniref:Uncharacterized protein n=1 Tax=Timema genevievae TaxID=629358 RepID=A0A7R9JYE8_TIMGE|nr:unnamed protein product [Timema genevievae]